MSPEQVLHQPGLNHCVQFSGYFFISISAVIFIMQFLQTAYFTTRVSQHTEEDCLNLKHKPTHRRSPSRPAQTPEIASSALQDRGDGISTAPLQQEPGLLLQLGAEREITPHHPFSPPL